MLSSAFRKLENSHVALWLVKDTCWLMGWPFGAFLMAIPTVIMAFYITWRTRRSTSELAHNLAVCCWILANITWMTGEFFYNDTWRPFAAVFFFAGLAIIALFYGRQLLLPANHKPAKKAAS